MLSGLSGISAQDQDCDMSWETENNVSLSSAALFDCKTTIRPENILTNPGACTGPKTVVVFSLDDLNTPIDVDPSLAGPQVDETFLGQRLKVIVTHDQTGAKAEAFITIEDKKAPELTCSDVVITCLDNADPVSEGGSVPDVIVEDCSSTTKAYNDTFISYDCGDDPFRVGTISRVWTVTDAGNETSTCTQTIDIVRINLGDGTITEPVDTDVSCSADLTQRWPENTGYPTLALGDSIYTLIPGEEGSCTLDVSYTDIQAAGSCPTKALILRTWTIRDLCNVSMDGSNPMTFVQKINIVDTEGPIITGVSDMTNGTSNQKCSAVVSFPPATASDNCGGATVAIHTPFGNIDANGGTLHDVPVGVHDVTYRATDDCGNVTDKIITLTVIDDDEPNVVCNQSLVVPLGNDGGAQIFAASFDDGSSDNCGIVSYQVARMASACGPETAFDDYVDFSCCDLDHNPIMVALKVSDAAGNYNICMVEVTVQDKVAPIITCPPFKELDCTDDYQNTNITGTPGVSDNCEIDEITYEDNDSDLNACGWGTVIRKWIAKDKSGNISECYQTITITNLNPFNGEEDITWPETYNATDCGAEIHPDSLPFPYGRPLLDVQDCDNVRSYFIDQAIGDNGGSACYAVDREWTVIDLCVYDANVSESIGKWTYVQRIYIDDTTDPVFTKGHENAEILVDGDCRNIVYTIMAEVEDCSPNLTYAYEIDLGNDGSIDSVGEAQMMTLDFFTEGTHKISWSVNDGCGNESSADQLITFRDTKAPNPNLKAIFVSLMPVNGGMIEVPAKDFNNSSTDNCTPIGWLKYSYSTDVNDTLRMFTCADLGQNTLDVYVHDGEGNTAFATTFVDIQDGNSVCAAVTANVSGMITTPGGEAIANVAVALEGSSMNALMTEVDGSYSINNLPQGSFKLKPSKNEAAMNGVSTYDMVLMQRHILGLVEISDPYTMIAADVNNSGTVSTSDMLAMRRLILNINDGFGSTQSWRFVVADHNFSTGGTFPEDYPLTNPTSDMQVDFIGIKMGDINSNANTNLLGGGEEIGAPLAFTVQDQRLVAGESYTISFNAKDFEDVIGFQYTLQFDAEVLDLGGINSGALDLNDQNFNLNDSDRGLVATNWYNALPVSVSDEDVLFSIEITAKENTLLSDVLTIGSEKTRAESYRQTNINSTLITGETELEFKELEIEVEGYELGQNAPNPFAGTTAINIQVPATIDGQLSIYDVTGKVVKVWNQQFDKGIHQISLTASDLPEGGVYYYQFAAGGFTATKKMVVIR